MQENMVHGHTASAPRHGGSTGAAARPPKEEQHMKLIQLAAAALFLILGVAMNAQTNQNPAKEDKIIVYGKSYPSIMLYLNQYNKLAIDENYVDWDMVTPIYHARNGKTFRRLSSADQKEYDAMPRIKAENGKLYFDGKNVRTNVMRVFEVASAYYWNGGVIVVAKTSKAKIGYWLMYRSEYEVGFIDHSTNKCDFIVAMRNADQQTPHFLVPVIINKSNKDFAFTVEMPERVSINERFDITVSLANVSSKVLLAPEDIYLNLEVGRKESDMLRSRNAPMWPGETRSTTFTADARQFFNWKFMSGRDGIDFYWSGFLNQDDKSELSIFKCEKLVETTTVDPFAIDTSNTDLVLEVIIPEKVILRKYKDINCVISLTNVSDKPIMVPESILDGFRAIQYINWGINSMIITKEPVADPKKGIFIRAEVKYPHKFPLPKSRLSPLMPSETRTAAIAFPDYSYYPSRYIFEFTWDIFLDPDDKSVMTRFMVDKEVLAVKK
jgi:hypothetical protein